MPARPAIARPLMTSFAMLRTCQLMPSANACTVNAGCLIWTPTKIAPAVAALMPAARVSVAVVRVMAGSCRSSSPGCPAVVEDVMNRRGDATSQSDVTRLVIRLGCRSEQAKLRGSKHRGAAGRHIQLGEDVLGVGA